MIEKKTPYKRYIATIWVLQHNTKQSVLKILGPIIAMRQIKMLKLQFNKFILEKIFLYQILLNKKDDDRKTMHEKMILRQKQLRLGKLTLLLPANPNQQATISNRVWVIFLKIIRSLIFAYMTRNKFVRPRLCVVV